jgi:Spy/CpxP family protein refolding chaperone
MNRTIKTLLLAGTLAVTGSALAFSGAHQGKGGRDCHRGGPGMALITQLDGLTDQQRTKLTQLRETQRESGRTLHDEMRQNRRALRKAMQDGSAETVAPLARKQGDLVEQMILRRFQMKEKVNAILTEEQRQQLQKLRAERHSDRWGE